MKDLLKEFREEGNKTVKAEEYEDVEVKEPSAQKEDYIDSLVKMLMQRLLIMAFSVSNMLNERSPTSSLPRKCLEALY